MFLNFINMAPQFFWIQIDPLQSPLLISYLSYKFILNFSRKKLSPSQFEWNLILEMEVFNLAKYEYLTDKP